MTRNLRQSVSLVLHQIIIILVLVVLETELKIRVYFSLAISVSPRVFFLSLFYFFLFLCCGGVVRWCWVNFQCRGVLLICITVEQGPTALAVGTGGDCLVLSSIISLFLLPLLGNGLI